MNLGIKNAFVAGPNGWAVLRQTDSLGNAASDTTVATAGTQRRLLALSISATG